MVGAFDEWVQQLSSALGVDGDVDVDSILEVARDAAHGVERRAAPVTTYLMGLSAGLAGGGVEAEERAVAVAKQLAAGWTSSE